MRTLPVHPDPRRVGLSCILAAGLVLLAGACSRVPGGSAPAPLGVAGVLGGSAVEGYERALEPRPLRFPEDHGAHPRFRNEWWYFTGNLQDGDGRDFGYQFTLFRTAIDPDPPRRASAWAGNQVYMAHAALSDIAGERYLFDERFSRGAPGLAGVQAEPLHAWLENWSVSGDGGSGGLTAVISVAARGFTLRLQVRDGRPAVLHGERGLSAKSPTPGNASYYYSHTRLATTGELELGGERHEVLGMSWFDHEWSTSALEEGQSGWDWFSLQLSDGSDLMLFRLRDAADAGRDYYSGTLVAPDSGVTVLARDQIVMQASGNWTSPRTGVRYPAVWNIELPGQATRLRVVPAMSDQEFDASFRYWEGSVRAAGSAGGREISGRGYMELTGYQ